MTWIKRFTLQIDAFTIITLYQNATEPLLQLVYNDGFNNICSSISNGNFVALRLSQTMHEYFAYELPNPHGFIPLQVYTMAITEI